MGKEFKAPKVSEIPPVKTAPIPKPMVETLENTSVAQPKTSQVDEVFAPPKVDTSSLPFDVDDNVKFIEKEEPKTVSNENTQENKPEVETSFISEPQPQETQSFEPQGQTKDGEIDPQKWLAVIRQAINEDKGLIGAINNSSAYKKGEMILIKSNNILFKKLMEQEYHINAVKKATKVVFGQDFKIVVSDGEELKEKQQNKERKDPLEDLVNHAKNLDFNFKIEEL